MTRLWPFIAPALWMSKSGQDVRGGPIHSTRHLDAVVVWANREGFNLYLSVNPARPHGRKARREDVIAWRHLLIDLDPESPDADLAASQTAVLGWLTENLGCSPENLHVLDSGRGRQLWIALEDDGATEKVHAERCSSLLLRTLRQDTRLERFGVHVDTSTSDLPRVGRCPGSINQKTGKEARLLSVASGRFPSAALISWATPRLNALVTPEPLASPESLSVVLPHLSWRARDFLMIGADEGGRHKAASHAARSLASLGVPMTLALSWIALGASRSRPPLQDPRTLTRAVTNAYER